MIIKYKMRFILKILMLTDIISLALSKIKAIDIPPDDDGPVHFLFNDDSGQNSPTDGHIAGEGALLVDEVSLASLIRGNK